MQKQALYSTCEIGTELQMRGGTDDNSKIIILISQ